MKEMLLYLQHHTTPGQNESPLRPKRRWFSLKLSITLRLAYFTDNKKINSDGPSLAGHRVPVNQCAQDWQERQESSNLCDKQVVLMLPLRNNIVKMIKLIV